MVNLFWLQCLSNLDARYHAVNLSANLSVDAQQDVPTLAGREVSQPRHFMKKITERDTVWVVWCWTSSARRHEQCLLTANKDAAACLRASIARGAYLEVTVEVGHAQPGLVDLPAMIVSMPRLWQSWYRY